MQVVLQNDRPAGCGPADLPVGRHRTGTVGKSKPQQGISEFGPLFPNTCIAISIGAIAHYQRSIAHQVQADKL